MHSIVLCSMSVNGFNEIPASLSDGSLIYRRSQSDHQPQMWTPTPTTAGPGPPQLMKKWLHLCFSCHNTTSELLLCAR